MWSVELVLGAGAAGVAKLAVLSYDGVSGAPRARTRSQNKTNEPELRAMVLTVCAIRPQIGSSCLQGSPFAGLAAMPFLKRSSGHMAVYVSGPAGLPSTGTRARAATYESAQQRPHPNPRVLVRQSSRTTWTKCSGYTIRQDRYYVGEAPRVLARGATPLSPRQVR